MLNPDVLSEVDFCRLCGFVFQDKQRKRNVVGQFVKMFEKVINAHCVTCVAIELRKRGGVGCLYRYFCNH